MGLDRDGLFMVAHARKMGAKFDKTLTIGRQTLCMSPVQVKKVARMVGIDNAYWFNRIDRGVEAPFSDDVFRLFGAWSVDSLDASGYEGANIIHNLNHPVPKELHNQYDFIYDGGTIEHVWNFPVALGNYMRMLKPGGFLIIGCPANNWMGHGFYQPSPEVFYRALSPENGFEVKKIVLSAIGPFKRWYEVADDQVIKDRVMLISMIRQYGLAVCAQKKEDVQDLFRNPPQQFEYDTEHLAKLEVRANDEGLFRKTFSVKHPRIYSMMYFFHPLLTVWRFYSRMSIWNRKYFKPVSRWPKEDKVKKPDGSGV